MKNNINKTTHYKLLALLLSFGLYSCDGGDTTSSSAQHSAGSKPPGKLIPIEVKQPDIGLAASFYVTTATIEPSSDAKINARTSGVVKEILHEEGDDVLAGEVLLILDDDDQQLRLEQAAQKLASASREFKRLSKMKKSGMVSPTEWETTENTFKTAETDKKLAELALSYTRVAAPFDGRVVWREIDLGAHIGQGDLLFRMMSIRPLLVRVHIPANRIGMVAKGQSVEIVLDNVATSIIGKVHLVSPIVDPNTGTLKVTVQLDNYPQNVRPGDFSEVHIVTEKHQDALLVPSTSILEERGQYFVFTAKKDKASKIEVVVGFAMQTQTEIMSGIKQDDLIVTKGQRNLKDGIAVEILTDTVSNNDTKNNGDKSDVGLKEKEKSSIRGNP